MNQEDLKLGEIIEDGRAVERDAIHIAVIPLEARETLFPGSKVRLSLDGKARAAKEDEHWIGVVDPYITTDWDGVETGQRFWCYLKPGSITSLRHDWTHPAFPAMSVQALGPDSIPGRVARKLGETESERYIREEGLELDLTFEEMLDIARDFQENDNHFSTGATEYQLRDDKEFWKHYQIVTGEKVLDGKKHSFFRCAC